MVEINQKIPEQIKAALDGRTQRWLSFRAQIPESELSKKMKCRAAFSEQELNYIQEILNFSIEQ